MPCRPCTAQPYFYPRPPRGGRLRLRRQSLFAKRFLSTPSARRATLSRLISSSRRVFLSTPSARRATRVPKYDDVTSDGISIHALREEGDVPRCLLLHARVRISIHALREEGDSAGAGRKCRGSDFYPRPPRGGRQWGFYALLYVGLFLSTPSARRATSRQRAGGVLLVISIHALREEGDAVKRRFSNLSQRFLSTPSARRATPRRADTFCWPQHFYPRPPRGGRPAGGKTRAAASAFLSTPSARRATMGS